jgi:VWFA-related protein
MKHQPLVAAITIVASMVSLRAQNPDQPVFRAEINLVRLAVRALDERDQPVTDLVTADIGVLEDDRPQMLDAFRLVAAPATERFTPDGTASLPPATIDADLARVYLVIVDNFDLTPPEMIKTRQILKTFFTGHLLPHDVAAIVAASGGGQDFTSNLGLLLKAVDKLYASPLRGGGRGFAGPIEQRLRSRSLLNAVSGSAERMSRDLSRRKTVILISNGTHCDAVSCASDVALSVRAARNAEASVYPLSPDGLMVPGYVSPVPGDAPPGRLKSPMSALNVLAQDTGGFVIADTNRIEEGLGRVIEDGRSYYLLTYYSNNELKNGQTRHITLTTTRKNVRLFYRESYIVGEKQ